MRYNISSATFCGRNIFKGDFAMANKKDITICILLETGIYSQRETAEKEGISNKIVMRIAYLNKGTIPDNSTSRQNGGRKRIITNRDNRQIIKLATKNYVLMDEKNSSEKTI